MSDLSRGSDKLKAAHKRYYRTNYGHSFNEMRKDTKAQESLKGTSMVGFYAGDLVKRSKYQAVADWWAHMRARVTLRPSLSSHPALCRYADQNERMQSRFKDVFRRLNEFVKRTTKEVSHDWSTNTRGKKSVMQVR